jgi:transposase
MKNKIAKEVSEEVFLEKILPCLTHKINHNQQKISYHKVFNYILQVLHSGMSWRTLKPENKEITWQNIYYHFNRWSKDGSFERLFEHSKILISNELDLSILNLDGSHTAAKKGANVLPIKVEKSKKRPII